MARRASTGKRRPAVTRKGEVRFVHGCVICHREEILKEMADAMILPIVPDRMAGERAPHEVGNPLERPEHQDMDIARQDPANDSASSVFGDLRDAGEKIPAVFILAKDGLSFGSSGHHEMQGSRASHLT